MNGAAHADVQVSEARSEDAVEWESFVKGAAEATFFHRFGWRTLLRDELRSQDRYLCARRDGCLVGVFPLVLLRTRFFGSSLTSLPFCSYAGPLAVDAKVESALMRSAVDLAEDLNVDRLEVRGLRPFVEAAPFQALYSTFRAPIPDRLEDLSGLPPKRRSAIRRARHLQLRATVSRDADRFYDLYAENARSHGTPALGRRFFSRLLDTFPDDCDILFVSDAVGKDLSAILNFYHRNEVLAYFAGEVPAASRCNANDFKYWSLMKHAAARGCTRFDFGRSKAGTGSFWFKAHWGFQPQQLHYEYPYLPSGKVPQHNPANPRFRAAIAIWRVLPRALTDRLGPAIVAGLG